MQLKLLPLVALAASVLADTNPIFSALETITTDTVDLNNTVSGWSGSILTILPIPFKSGKLLSDIKSGTRHAQKAANLTFDETIQVAQATINLATDVNQTIETIISAKPKFDRLLLVSPIILWNLEEQQKATRDFSNAVISKVPEGLQDVAKNVVKGIDDSFNKGIQAYHL